MKHPIWLFVVTAMLAMPALSTPADELLANSHEVKYVIFMVPDGMGLADVTATRIQKNGAAGAPLSFEALEHIGYERTYSEQNTVTDSAAAASAWACGEKFVNQEICFHADGRPHNRSLLEVAKENGWGTGLVATQTITHATPAAFAAHLANRNCETEIARQYVEETQPDVMLGGGQATFNPSAADICGVFGNFIVEAQGRGYTYVTTKQAMDEAVANGVTRLLGLFAAKNLTPEFQRTPGLLQPRLPETAAAALAILEKHPTGFFLMIEGSLIDSGNHAENLPYQYGEMLAFDESVQVVRNWINASPERREHTLLIVAPDHETGGFAIIAPETPGAGLGPFTPGWTFPPISPTNPEAHHTGGDEPIWSEGPGSEALGKAIENTDVYRVVSEVIE